MNFEISCQTKSFVTQRTFVSAFSFMDTLDMDFDRASLSKSFIAYRTFEFAFSFVDIGDVAFEVIHLPKSFIAQRTFEVAFCLMDYTDVAFEMVLKSEILITQSTFVVAFPSMDQTDVDFEILAAKKFATLRTFELFTAFDFVQAQLQSRIHELAAALVLLGSKIYFLYPIILNFFCRNLIRHFVLLFFHFFFLKLIKN